MKKANKIVAFIMGTALVLLLMYNVYMYFDQEDKTQLAIMGTIENKVDVVGYVIRDEKVLVGDEGKVVSNVKSNGERVAVGELVAIVYDNVIDYETRAKLASINEQIEKLKELKSQSQGGQFSGKFETKIKTYVNGLILNTHRSTSEGIYEATVQLKDAFSAKLASNSEDVDGAIEELQKEKDSIEQSVTGNKTNIYANKSGLYVMSFDGYENVFDVSKIEELTPTMLKEVDSIAAKTSTSSAVKIVDNFNWYYAAMVDSKKLTAEKPGNTVKLRLADDLENELSATIKYISPEEKDKCVVVLEGTTYNKQLFMKNKIQAQIVFDDSEGLKISKDAVKVVDGVKGVYIIKKGVHAFREINIIGSDDEYVIVERDFATDKPHLALYDEVIVHGYEGE